MADGARSSNGAGPGVVEKVYDSTMPEVAVIRFEVGSVEGPVIRRSRSDAHCRLVAGLRGREAKDGIGTASKSRASDLSAGNLAVNFRGDDHTAMIAAAETGRGEAPTGRPTASARAVERN